MRSELVREHRFNNKGNKNYNTKIFQKISLKINSLILYQKVYYIL